MANVLKNFLIGVGLDTEKYDKGAKKVENSLERMRSLVGFTGSAITGAFGAVGLAAINAGRRVDQFALATEGLKTSPQYIYDYGRALVALGGNADEAVAAIKSIEKAQSDFSLKGMLGPLEDVALARGDINMLTQAKDGKEFLRALAPMVQNMNKDQQRLVQDTLGLSDAVMRSLRGGVDQLDEAVARAHDLAGNLIDATGAAREYNRALAELGTRLEGIGNTLAEKILPGFTSVIDSIGGFIDSNRDLISKGAEVMGENPAATALITGGGTATVAGAALRGTGVMRGAGMALSRFGWQGMALGGALIAGDMAYDWWHDREKSNNADGSGDWNLSDWWDQSVESAKGYWRDITGRNESSQIAPSEPVYSGGEVNNVEAANVSPDVVLLKESRRKESVLSAPQPIKVQNHIDLRMELDGKQLESKIIDVQERRERDTIGDITSSVER